MPDTNAYAAAESLKGALEAAVSASLQLAAVGSELQQSLHMIGTQIDEALTVAVPAKLGYFENAVDLVRKELDRSCALAVQQLGQLGVAIQEMGAQFEVQVQVPLTGAMDGLDRTVVQAGIHADEAYAQLENAVGHAEGTCKDATLALAVAHESASGELAGLGATFRQEAAALVLAVAGIERLVEEEQAELASHLKDEWLPQLEAAMAAHQSLLQTLETEDIRKAIDGLKADTLAEARQQLQDGLKLLVEHVTASIGKVLDEFDNRKDKHVVDRATAKELTAAVKQVFEVLESLVPEIRAIHDMVSHLM